MRKSSASRKSMARTRRCPMSCRLDTSGVVLSGVDDEYSRIVHSDGLGAGGAVASVLGMSTLALSVSGPLHTRGYARAHASPASAERTRGDHGRE